MARHLFPSLSVLWQRHVDLYNKIFSDALESLACYDTLSGNEDTISEILYVIINDICFKFSKSSNKEVRTPIWECQIPPVSYNNLKGKKTHKKPDFTCRCSNPWADSPELHEISLHVECKRLGNPTSTTWILNKNYVKNGIERFDNSIHEYGKNASSGIMIGYIISMEPSEVINEVNGYQSIYLPDNPAISFAYDDNKVFQTSQDLQRKIIAPYDFKLIHIWVDLRRNYKL